jgi:hypothetical protein
LYQKVSRFENSLADGLSCYFLLNSYSYSSASSSSSSSYIADVVPVTARSSDQRRRQNRPLIKASFSQQACVETWHGVFLSLKLNVLSICLVLVCRRGDMWDCVPHLASRARGSASVECASRFQSLLLTLPPTHLSIHLLASEECVVE